MLPNDIHALIEALQDHLPPVFLGTELDERTGNAVRWRKFQNDRSKGKVPEGIVIYRGRRALVVRDPFLEWLPTTLTVRCPVPVPPPPQPRAGRKHRARVQDATPDRQKRGRARRALPEMTVASS